MSKGKKALYRKKPIVVEAYRVFEREIVDTLEGTMIAEHGDWIVTGVEGERYPVKDRIFWKTYERLPEAAMKAYQSKLEGGVAVATGHPIRDQLAAIMENEPETQDDEDLLTVRWFAVHHTRLVYDIRASHLRDIVRTYRKANIRERRRELTTMGYPWPPEEAERRKRRGKAGPP